MVSTEAGSLADNELADLDFRAGVVDIDSRQVALRVVVEHDSLGNLSALDADVGQTILSVPPGTLKPPVLRRGTQPWEKQAQAGLPVPRCHGASAPMLAHGGRRTSCCTDQPINGRPLNGYGPTGILMIFFWIAYCTSCALL